MSMSRRSVGAASAALVAAAAIATVGSVASAAPVAKPFEVQPSAVNFGSVPVDGTSASVKTVKMLNRTKQTFVYKGARWPNFGNPGGWEYPYGFWSISGDGDEYPCYEIQPRSYCILTFQFKPKELGSYGTFFAPRYGPDPDGPYGPLEGPTYTDSVSMRGTGVLPPPAP